MTSEPSHVIVLVLQAIATTAPALYTGTAFELPGYIII
jgi:hypothetical protein